MILKISQGCPNSAFVVKKKAVNPALKSNPSPK